MDIWSILLLCIMIGVPLISIVQDFLMNPKFTVAHLGRELHTASLALILSSYFVNRSDPWILGTLFFALATFGLTAICIYGAEGRFQTKSGHFERIGLTIGFIFISVGIGIALSTWP